MHEAHFEWARGKKCNCLQSNMKPMYIKNLKKYEKVTKKDTTYTWTWYCMYVQNEVVMFHALNLLLRRLSLKWSSTDILTWYCMDYHDKRYWCKMFCHIAQACLLPSFFSSLFPFISHSHMRSSFLLPCCPLSLYLSLVGVVHWYAGWCWLVFAGEG